MRDAAIYETWEGPYTLLLVQAFGDLVRFEIRGREQALLRAGVADEGHLRPSSLSSLREVLDDPDPRRTRCASATSPTPTTPPIRERR